MSEPVVEGSGDEAELAILAGVERARKHGHEIGKRAARVIVRHLFNPLPEDGPLRDLARCGAIREDATYRALYEAASGRSHGQQVMMDALLSYCVSREDKGPIQHWNREETDRDTESGYKPMVFIGCLAASNNGHLHGMWIDAFQEPDQISAEIDCVLQTSPMPDAEEYAVFDQDDFAGLDVSQYASVEQISRLGNAVAEYGEAFALYVAENDARDDDIVERYERAFRGHWQSMEEFVDDELDNTGILDRIENAIEVVPEELRMYLQFDRKAYAEDLETNYYTVAHAADGGVYVYDDTSD